MTSLESMMRQLGEGKITDSESTQSIAQKWMVLWSGLGAEKGLQGVGAPLLLDWCRGSERPSNTQLGRMTGMIAIMESITASFPLTVREGEAFMKEPSRHLEGIVPLEVMHSFQIGSPEAPEQGLQLARATATYIDESLGFLHALHRGSVHLNKVS